MPQAVVVDSGPCVALFDRDDEYHKRAIDFIRHCHNPLMSTLAVITEVMSVLDFSLRAQTDFLTWVKSGAMQLVEPVGQDYDRVIQLMEKYSDLPMDFTDGLLVAMAERLNTKHIASIDNDFTIYRYRGRGKFVNVF